MSERIRVVCFDLGGVLVRLVKGGWAGACAAAGVSVDVADPAVWGRHAELLRRFEVGEFGEEEYLRGVRACLPGEDCAGVLRAFDAWLCGMYAGAEELIDELKGRGVTTACLSNTNARHWRLLVRDDPRYRGLLKLDHLLASHDLGVAKPDERIYRAAEGRLGVRGGEVLFFDDRAENVAGARAAGWRGEVVGDGEDAVGEVRRYLAKWGVL